jgi:regulator of RNase E activity RraA
MNETESLERVSSETLERLKNASIATVSSLLNRRGFQQMYMIGVKPIRPDLRMAGQAFTLRYIPSRTDLERTGEFDNRTNKQRIAVESVGPGDVLVIDARRDIRAGSLGNILATRVKHRGAAGIVTDGSFRDTPAFADIDLPTYATGQSPDISFTIHHPVDINVPISCAGVAVLPGDVIVGDAEGVIVVPRQLADEVAAEAVELEQKEEFLLTKIESGRSIHGVYPPDGETLREFETWKANR